MNRMVDTPRIGAIEPKQTVTLAPKLMRRQQHYPAEYAKAYEVEPIAEPVPAMSPPLLDSNRAFTRNGDRKEVSP